MNELDSLVNLILMDFEVEALNNFFIVLHSISYFLDYQAHLVLLAYLIKDKVKHLVFIL